MCVCVCVCVCVCARVKLEGGIIIERQIPITQPVNVIAVESVSSTESVNKSFIIPRATDIYFSGTKPQSA